MQFRLVVLAASLGIGAPVSLVAADPAPPQVAELSVTNAQKTLRWLPYPHAQQYQVLTATNLGEGLAPDSSGNLVGYTWTATNFHSHQFYQLRATPLSSNALLTAQVLNRLAYGPTPDEVERVMAMGPQAYIEEQLAPENLPETLDNVYTAVITNANPNYTPPPVTNGWAFVTYTGRMSSNLLYLYLNAAGEGYIDDVRLVAGTVAGVGSNFLANGDFELPLTNGWTVAANHSGSHVTNAPACSGSNSLHLRATSAGSALSSAISQIFPTTMTNNETCILSYWYLPSTNYANLTVRLSGNGINSAGGAVAPPPPPVWVHYAATGPATSTTFYFYLTQTGLREAWVDDIQLVAGTVPETGPNLIQNGGFELPLTNGWKVSTNLSNSEITTNISRSGLASLHLVSTSAGSSLGSSIYQTNLALTTNATYTLSFWYLLTPSGGVQRGDDFTARLAGTGISRSSVSPLVRLENSTASLAELRTWFCRNAVESKRQLLEILTQFLENHFVTQQSKSSDYFASVANNSGRAGSWAADLEYREIKKWRQKLLDPQCSFRDLLRISAESPAMIIYLDTVNSKGNGSNVANENYARELLELFTFGVDNGYDQNDIVQMSRAWTGWSVEIVAPENFHNPFAPKATLNIVPGSATAQSNLAGVYSFNYKSGNHYTNSKVIFPATNHVVPHRFAAVSPLADQTYQLTLPARFGTNGIQDGYDVVDYLADLPFTQEYISVKLCRWFVHDDFEHGVYDYNDPNLSDEGKLVKQCMLAWEGSNPKGNLRAILNAIFSSELFRTRAGALHKIKTPLEYAVSAVRAVRVQKADGTYTAVTDGNFSTPLNRIGSMLLFDRAAPDGYPEQGPPWISASTLAERLRFVQSLLHSSSGRPTDAGTGNTTDPVALLQRKVTDSIKWRDAGAVADFFLSILYPGEGKANLDLYRQSAIGFLNTADDGITPSLFANLTVSSTAGSAYDTRVRGMVGMLMTFQRFQEQ